MTSSQFIDCESSKPAYFGLCRVVVVVEASRLVAAASCGVVVVCDKPKKAFKSVLLASVSNVRFEYRNWSAIVVLAENFFKRKSAISSSQNLQARKTLLLNAKE